jgi:sugar phosphate isomerase/epimerase
MSDIPRRGFLRTLAGSVTATTLARTAWASDDAKPATARRRLPLAFSTLGCPAWEWPRILDEADRMGYAALELRGIQGEMDLTRRPEFQGPELKENLDRLAARGLRISDLGSSAEMHHPEGPTRTAQLDEGRRFIDLAHALGAPYVRVFGNKLAPGEERRATVERVVAGLRALGEHAKGSGVGVLVESHGDFTRSADLLEILTSAGMPNVGLLWDAHHTVTSGGEAPADTFRALGRFIRHTHLKDSRPDGDGVRYVLTGEGTVPVKAIVKVLVDGGYQGFYCFEWEKKWHPEIEEPEIAFPHYARVMTAYLADAGVKA